jgi:DNA-binding transcriptional MerR regulator
MTTEVALKIGDVARLAGTTTRTIRYYEELGIMRSAEDRPSGSHRAYTQADVDRLRHILRLKGLLGVSLDELRDLLAAEDARLERREEFQRTTDASRRRELLDDAVSYLDRQLELVRRRRGEIDALEEELVARRERATAWRSELTDAD